MAIFEPGPLIGRIRGKIGGMVATNSRSSPVLRAWSYPTDPATPAQVTTRANLSAIAAAWRDDTTPTQRANWGITAATATLPNSLGNHFVPSGRQFFFRANTWRLSVGLPILVIPIAIFFSQWPNPTLSEIAGPNLRLTATGDTTGINEIGVRTHISPPLNPTLNQWSGPWSAPVLTIWNPVAVPTNIIGPDLLPVNARYFLRIKPARGGAAIAQYQNYQIDLTLA